MAAIEESEVRGIADLAHLSLGDDEVARMTTELSAVLAYVAELQQVDVAGVPPTAHVLLEALPTREDVPRPSLPREVALSQAPAAREDGFAVPTFVDEG